MVERGSIFSLLKSEETYEKAKNLIVHEDENSGFALDEDGEIFSIYNVSDKYDNLEKLFLLAIEKGGNIIDTVYSEALASLYERYGFEPVARTRFDSEYVSDDFDYETYGEPDIILFKYNGKAPSRIIRDKRNKTYETYDYSKLPEFPDLESARSYRDELIIKGEDMVDIMDYFEEYNLSDELKTKVENLTPFQQKVFYEVLGFREHFKESNETMFQWFMDEIEAVNRCDGKDTPYNTAKFAVLGLIF